MGEVAGGVVRRRDWKGANGVMAVEVERESVMDSSDGETSRPLVVALSCVEECGLEREALAGIADFRHVGLAELAEGKVEEAAAVVVRSLAHLPGAARRRLKPWQLILCLSSADKAVDTVLAFELGLQLFHVDRKRVEEVADTTLALMLGLLRRTHVLAKKSYGATDRWLQLGTAHSVCQGMRRCRGLVLGVVGASATACAVAVRSLAFRMLVIYFDPEAKGAGTKRWLPAAAKKVDSLTELLATSDVVSLHCAITRDTVQLINGEALRAMKPGAILINTSSSHLIDDCELKQAIINGTVAGCALDGVEGHHWIESWVKEMPNVIITPRSADYSEEVWLEIRAKAVELLRSFVLDNLIPTEVTSDDDDDEYYNSFTEEEQHKTPWKETFKEEIRTQHDGPGGNTSSTNSESRQKQMIFEAQNSGSLDQNTELDSPEVRGSGRRARRRPGRRKTQQNFQSPGDQLTPVSVGGWERRPTSQLSFASPDQGDAKLKTIVDVPMGRGQLGMGLAIDQLKEGYVVALHALSGGGFYVARQTGPGRGWCLDIVSNVTIQDPAAQFLLIIRNRDRIGLRSFAAGGKLLQTNKKLELVFVNHTFDVWEGWFVEGRTIQNCNLTNSRFRSVNLHVSMRILAAVGEEDGIARWIG